MSEILDLEDLVRRIPRGALLAVPPDHGGVAMAATRALIAACIGAELAEVYPPFAHAMCGEAA